MRKQRAGIGALHNGVIVFEDGNFTPCSVQQANPGSIWVGPDRNAVFTERGPVNSFSRMKLERTQVQQLVNTLQKWLRTGSLGG